MYEGIEDVVWLRKQLDYQLEMRLDLARINDKVITKLEKKNSKQKKQIAKLVAEVQHQKEEINKWIGAFAGQGKQINKLEDWKSEAERIWDEEHN